MKLMNVTESSTVTVRIKVCTTVGESGLHRAYCVPPGRVLKDGEGTVDIGVEDNDLGIATRMALANALERIALEIRRGARVPDLSVYGYGQKEEQR